MERPSRRTGAVIEKRVRRAARNPGFIDLEAIADLMR
jgi:hypothetical protein